MMILAQKAFGWKKKTRFKLNEILENRLCNELSIKWHKIKRGRPLSSGLMQTIIIMVLFYLFIQYYAVLKEISIR